MITKRIARFVAETPAAAYPEAARRVARLAIMDIIGVALVGSREETGKIITGYVKDLGGTPEAGVIGGGFKVSPYLAALANGTMGHILNFDDVSFTFWQGHPSVCVAPPVLAIGEKVGASGADVIRAYITGFEVGACLHAELGLEQIREGWHGTSAIGSVGAAAGAARLLKLDVHQVRMALGIAASLSCGLAQNTGTMTKPLHAGHAAANGVLAASLAQRGFTADPSIIEAPKGYARVFGHEAEVDWKTAAKDLGQTFIIDKAIEFKPYPTAVCTRLVPAVIKLRERYKMDPNKVGEIIFGVSPSEIASQPQLPTDSLQCQFSMTYCVCRALLDGKFTVSSISDEQVRQPEVHHLMKLVRFIERYPNSRREDQRVGKRSLQSVTIRMKDGQEYSYESSTQAERMTVEELEKKYCDCAFQVLDDKAVEKSLTLLKNLESVDNIRELMEIVSKTRSKVSSRK
jgi:2-methylcitrate dehydratase PrpD